MKNKINLEALMRDQGISQEDLADFLFPMNQFPKQALSRVLSGRSSLDENQISRLAIKYDLKVGDLFNSGWKVRANLNNEHIFTNGKHYALLNIDTMSTKFFVEGEMTHEVVLSAKSITLTDYINFLNTLKHD